MGNKWHVRMGGTGLKIEKKKKLSCQGSILTNELWERFFLGGRGDLVGMGCTRFEALGEYNWVRHEWRPSWNQNQKPSCWGLVLANETWEYSFSDRGDPIEVE